MLVMAKRRNTKKDDTPRKPARTGAAINAWIDQALMDALDAYVESTDPRVSKTASLEAALRQFLAGKGFWPPSAKTGG